MNNDQINRFLERLGQAVSAGDLRGISNCWQVPALVLSDDGETEVSDTSQIEQFFGVLAALRRRN